MNIRGLMSKIVEDLCLLLLYLEGSRYNNYYDHHYNSRNKCYSFSSIYSREKVSPKGLKYVILCKLKKMPNF